MLNWICCFLLIDNPVMTALVVMGLVGQRVLRSSFP